MKKNIFSLTALGIVAASMFFASCKKDDATPAEEKYKLVGKIDVARTTITTAALTNAEFVITYNQANSFGDVQSSLNGSFTLSGYTGLTVAGGVADTLAFFATRQGNPSISYLTVRTTAFNSTNATNVYSYFNGSNASFSYINFPFSNDITSALKEGRGFFRLGKAPRYVFINLDNVTKL